MSSAHRRDGREGSPLGSCISRRDRELPCHDARVKDGVTPDGFLELGDLPGRWAQCEKVKRLSRREAEAWDKRIVSPRQLDEGQVGGHRVYAAAERYLTIADENHDALMSLLEHFGATPTAPWNLLRPTFEASFYALWLLRPDESLERRRRGVQLEWLDDEAARKYQAAALSDASVLAELGLEGVAPVGADDRDNTQIYAGEADRLGLTYRATDKRGKRVRPEPHRVVVENELASVAPDATVALGLRTTWKTLSGIQHAEGSAMLRVSHSSPRGTYPGGQRVLLTTKDAAFYTASISTTLLRLLAWSRFGDCHRPIRSNDPIDLAPLRAIAAKALQAQPPTTP